MRRASTRGMSYRTVVRICGSLLVAGLGSWSQPGLTDPIEGEAARLLQSRSTEAYELVAPDSRTRMGGARIAVRAPLAVVRSVVTDYGHYADFLPEFRKSRILGRSAAGTDVYLEVPILHGATSFWAVTRFSDPMREGEGERIEGRRQEQGNVDDLRAVWHLYPADDMHTILKLEILLLPRLPVPPSVLASELREAAGRAVTAACTRAERPR
jgi:hypothetical protein